MDRNKAELLRAFILLLWSMSILASEIPPTVEIKDITSRSDLALSYDSVIIIGENWENTYYPDFFAPYLRQIDALSEVDETVFESITVFVVFNITKSPKWAVWCPTGPLNRDYDDVRSYKEAAYNGMKRALRAGKKNPILVIFNSEGQRSSKKFRNVLEVSFLGALEAAYMPLEVRENTSINDTRLESVGYFSMEKDSPRKSEKVRRFVQALEHGRAVARDIAGSDPERMTPMKTEKYIRKVLKDSDVKINVTSGHASFLQKYPLFAAVDRCANTVPRHRGRMIYLEYTGENVHSTYMFVGKGVTYDTGGANLKTGGYMTGMHRDKSGAGAVAGLFAILGKLKPKGVKVVATLPMVRNSIGAESYLTDEIITSAAGVRVRVRNTDAEGRMTMVDPLFYFKQQALKEINPHIFTIATLTGHAVLTMGIEYSVLMDNGPAKTEGFAQVLQTVGDQMADPFEVSTLRKEDFRVIEGSYGYEDVIQRSKNSRRGHQVPMAFMMRASGLDKHGSDSSHPIRYSHIDIAGSVGKYPGIPTAAPIPSLAKLILENTDSLSPEKILTKSDNTQSN